ncbi:MAG: type II toxin-antitoxin system RelE/ParE family toxin [Syntrophobacteraceae bacterium]|jgi:toxin ParE1/3/4
MPVIIKRPRARSDLADIWDYIADDSEVRADAFVEAIDQKFHALAAQPNLGRGRDELAKTLVKLMEHRAKSSCFLLPASCF